MELRSEKPCALWVLTFPYGSQTFFFSQRTILFLTEVAYFLSQKSTDEQNTQHSTETLSQPISQNLTAIFGSNVLWILYAGGVLWARNVGWKVLLNLWVLWEKNLPTNLYVHLKPPWTLCALWEKKLPKNSQAPFLLQWVRSISHRRTQKNRTHKAHRDIKSTDNTERYS